MLSSSNVRVLLASCVGTGLVVFLIPVLIRGCSGATVFAEKVRQARIHLQAAQNEEALKVLSSTNDSSAPADYHYLKSVTLDRLGRMEAALAEIDRAIEDEPSNPRYKGMQLKLRLFARDRGSIDQLIVLHKDHASDAALSFFATFAYEAKARLLRKDKKPQSAGHHEERGQQTLETSFTMSDDIPEWHPELLKFAMRDKRDEYAISLVNRMLKQNPKSIDLRNEKIKVLVRLKENQEAVDLALELHKETGQEQKGAEFLATVMTFANSSKDNDQNFRLLVNEYPRNTLISSKYAMYLARNARINEADEHLDSAIEKQTSREAREALAFVAVTLPLEADMPNVAEQHLRKYRKFIADDLLVTYFEARILYLRKQYAESVRKMIAVVRESRKQGGASQIMAQEALVWIRNIMTTKVISRQMERVLDATRQVAPDEDVVIEKPISGTDTKPDSTSKIPDENPAGDGQPAPTVESPGVEREASNIMP